MKTLEELYNEVMASEDLKQEFLALNPEEVEGFAEKHGCKAALEDIKAFLTEKSAACSELSDKELEQIAGGKSADGFEIFASIISVGTACAIIAGVSAVSGKCGTAIEGEGMLCET